jgi:hypothetical protein
MRTKRLCVLTAAAGALLLAPIPAEAQFRRGRTVPSEGWTPASIGVRGGRDESARGWVVGAHAHIPILRNGQVEIGPSADITFLDGAEEYQYTLDVAWIMGGRSGGLSLGGGIGLRDTVAGAASVEDRRTVTSFSLFGGLRTAPYGWAQLFLDFRWIHLQDDSLEGVDYNPSPFSLGVAIPLWGRRAEQS